MKSVAILCTALCWACFAAALDQEGTRQEILALYSFSPHTLPVAERDQKSKAMDAFWERAKAHRKVYIPLLQEQLQATNVPPFFLFDGSRLLLELSDTAENRKIALQALARCDLGDVDGTVYLRQIHLLATTGADTTDAAFHILEEPKFNAFIPEHSLTLGQDFCLMLMLFPTDSTHWLQRATKRLQVETDLEAQKSLLYLLWYAQSDAADAAVAAFAKATNKPAASREFAQQLATWNKTRLDGASPHDKRLNVKESEASFRKARVKTMSRISDEALEEFDAETLKLIVIRWKNAQPK